VALRWPSLMVFSKVVVPWSPNGEFWGDGYYVRTVGSEVTEAVIREYIKKQGQETQHKSYEQLRLF